MSVPEPIDWAAWYAEALDGLLAAINDASINWAADPDGDPYIIPGQQRPAGIDYPHAMVLSFRKRRNGSDSTRRDEHHTIESSISVFDRDDPREYEGNLRKTIAQMGAVETALYADRSLGGSCELVTVTESNAFELATDDGRETVGDVQIEIEKTAEHPH